MRSCFCSAGFLNGNIGNTAKINSISISKYNYTPEITELKGRDKELTNIKLKKADEQKKEGIKLKKIIKKEKSL